MVRPLTAAAAARRLLGALADDLMTKPQRPERPFMREFVQGLGQVTGRDKFFGERAARPKISVRQSLIRRH
jgi:hypothetical protein